MGFHHIGQAVLKLLTANDPPALASQKSLTLSPRLEHSGAIIVHCSLELLGSRDPSASASQRWGLALLPGLKCSGKITAHCSLEAMGFYKQSSHLGLLTPCCSYLLSPSRWFSKLASRLVIATQIFRVRLSRAGHMR
ncbi:hypothetical protein AAY473_002401 [Plecturocebus cupreus]